MTITKLRLALIETGLDSTTVAARVGISNALMSQFVCGHRPIRPIYHLLNLAEVLGRRPSELLGHTEIGVVMSTTEPLDVPGPESDEPIPVPDIPPEPVPDPAHAE